MATVIFYKWTLLRPALAAGLLVAILVGPPARAQDEPQRKGFWFGAELGYGSLCLESSRESGRDGRFALALKAGWTVGPRFLLGAQANGWLLEGSNVNDPSEGANLGTFLMITQIYPSRHHGFFVKAGAGYSRLSDNRPTEHGSSGRGAIVGVGYDVPISKRWALTPIVNYNWGQLDDVPVVVPPIFDREYRAVDLMIGITLR